MEIYLPLVTLLKSLSMNLKEEINYYLDFYRPMDKAGSYGIQDWMGYVGIKNGGRFFQCNGTSIT